MDTLNEMTYTSSVELENFTLQRTTLQEPIERTESQGRDAEQTHFSGDVYKQKVNTHKISRAKTFLVSFLWHLFQCGYIGEKSLFLRLQSHAFGETRTASVGLSLLQLLQHQEKKRTQNRCFEYKMLH